MPMLSFLTQCDHDKFQVSLDEIKSRAFKLYWLDSKLVSSHFFQDEVDSERFFGVDLSGLSDSSDFVFFHDS